MCSRPETIKVWNNKIKACHCGRIGNINTVHSKMWDSVFGEPQAAVNTKAFNLNTVALFLKTTCPPPLFRLETGSVVKELRRSYTSFFLIFVFISFLPRDTMHMLSCTGVCVSCCCIVSKLLNISPNIFTIW